MRTIPILRRCDTRLRTGISARGLSYVAGILGGRPWPDHFFGGSGARPDGHTLVCGMIRRDDNHRPISVKEPAIGLPKRAWRTIKWREGTNDALSSRFARVRAAHRDYNLTESRSEEWLLIEWPKGEEEPTQYWPSTVPDTMAVHRLVDLAKLRWRIERDYQDLKQEVGHEHYEGRGGRGFHHHATLCIAAYGFLVSEHEAISPCGPATAALVPQFAIPEGYRPRGATLAA